MQTFLPFADFKKTAESLDRQRLGKQRVEVKQILISLMTKGAWYNHPAVQMWEGHEYCLLEYGKTICDEWCERGYIDSLWIEFHVAQQNLKNTGPPFWLGDERVHSSHRGNLIRKFDSHYRGKLGWTDSPEQPYFWPV